MSLVMMAIYRRKVGTPETTKVEYVEGVRFRDAVMNMHKNLPVSVIVETEVGVATLTIRPEDVSLIILTEV